MIPLDGLLKQLGCICLNSTVPARRTSTLHFRRRYLKYGYFSTGKSDDCNCNGLDNLRARPPHWLAASERVHRDENDLAKASGTQLSPYLAAAKSLEHFSGVKSA
jgi:hypothetical protein